jgi:hypothetical protein
MPVDRLGHRRRVGLPQRRAGLEVSEQESLDLPLFGGNSFERGILLEYPLLESPQRRRRLDAQFFDQRLPRARIDPQGIDLTSRSIQRLHVLADQALAERVLPGEGLEFADQLDVSAYPEVSLDPFLEHRQSHLFEASHLTVDRGMPDQVVVGSALPQRQGLRQRSCGGRRIIIQTAARFGCDRLEVEHIELLGGDLEDVARPAPLWSAVEDLAQLRDVGQKRVTGRGRLVVTPYRIDQVGDRRSPVGVYQQCREDHPLLWSAKIERNAFTPDGQWS